VPFVTSPDASFGIGELLIDIHRYDTLDVGAVGLRA
jgi:hypothetical protein